MNQGKPKGEGGGRRRRSSRRRGANASGRREPQRSHAAKPMRGSVFSKPRPSKVTITPRERGLNEPFLGREYIFALLGILLMVLLGGGSHVAAQGFALFVVGWAILQNPPSLGFGRWFNAGALLFLLGGLMTFLPGGLGFLPEWQKEGLNFSGTSTVQPRRSLEAFLLVLTTIVWVYVIRNIIINQTGRKWAFLGVAIFSLIIGLLAIAGVHYGWHYPGSPRIEIFSFFGEAGQMGWLLLLCGIFSFIYGMESLTHRSPLHLLGLPSSAACFIGLLSGQHYTEVLFFFLGAGIFCCYRLWCAEMKVWIKLAAGISLFVGLYGLLIWEGSLLELAVEPRLRVEGWRMFSEMPLTGIGLANYASIAPHYLEGWQSGNLAIKFQNDIIWVACVTGIVGLLGFFGMLVGIFREMEFSKIRRLGSIRFISCLTLIIYLSYGFSGEGHHSIALIYFVILLLVLSLPLEAREGGRLPPWMWKVCAYLLLAVGSLWIFGSLTGLPTHSDLVVERQKDILGQARAEENLNGQLDSLDRLIKVEPMNWYWRYEHAKLLLGIREREQASAGFKQALLLEPNLVGPAFRIGRAWFGYSGREAELAWAEALRRAVPDSEDLYRRMFAEGKDDPNQAAALMRLSRSNLKYAVIFMELARDRQFQQELKHYLDVDPGLGQFSRSQRTRIVQRWISTGESEGPSNYMDKYASTLDLAWYLQSCIYQNEARFSEAMELLRAGLQRPVLPSGKDHPAEVTIMERELASNPHNFQVGLKLIRLCFDREDYERGLQLTKGLLEYSDAPLELHYWQAEFYRLKENLVESWLSLEIYARQVLNLQRQ